jgi:hypothetical protein
MQTTLHGSLSVMTLPRSCVTPAKHSEQQKARTISHYWMLKPHFERRSRSISISYCPTIRMMVITDIM